MNNRKEFLKYAVHHHGMSSHTVEDYISATHSPVSGPDNMTRTVIEERPMPFREVDVFSRLMADRIIFLGTGVDDYIANIIQAQLLFLESTDPGKDIQIYINSPAEACMQASASTTPCSTSAQMWRPSARAWRRPWVPCCCAAVQPENERD